MPATTTTHQSAPSGEQHGIGHGRQQLVVTEVGATIRSYAVDGADVLDGFALDDMCEGGRGQVLAPWPNRLGDGRYSFEGRSAAAALDEPERHNAIHGLVRWLPWQVLSRAQNVLCLGCTLHAQPGYPWQLALTMEYRLGRDGLSVTAGATNIDRVAVPFGIGFHPYLAVSSSTIDTASLLVPARRRLVTDERGLPTSSTAVAGSEYDFRTPRWVGTTRLDTAFTDLQPDPDGLVRVDLDDPGGRGVTLWMDDSFDYVMLYTGDTLEPPERRRSAVAVEPMTCPPDAFRSGQDLLRLEPGGSWTGRWGITPR
ncbi:MAG: aldose 1-epimerase family protein [Acidimicrobiales bacterium]